MRHYHSYEDLITKNLQWANAKLAQEPAYFEQMTTYQKPPFLFVGCSDSRVPIDTFTQTEPGELFIHRNIANQISQTDMNFLSVLEYAIEVLQVKHIIVCGHYNCGGVEAAYYNNAKGLTENWVTQIKDIARHNKEELDAISDVGARLDRLTEMNVTTQVKNIFKVSSLKRLIEQNAYYPTVHGWVLNIRQGLIQEIVLPIDEWKEDGVVPKNYTDRTL